MLYLCVSLDFPSAAIYQCSNGHLLCDGCFTRVVEGNQPVCPTCRVSLSRDRPIRSRFAETVLSALPVPCTNVGSGCTQHVRYGQLSAHLTSECLYRRADCKYHPLGCDWAGYARDLRRHQRQCPVKSLPVKELLAGVQRRNEQQAARQQVQNRINDRYQRATGYLSKRCRDIQVRDVTIEHDSITGERCANTFVACGKAWQIFLDPLERLSAQPVSASEATSGAASANDSTQSAQPANPASGVSGALSLSSSSGPASLPPSVLVGVCGPSVYCRMHITCVSPIRRRCVMMFVFLRGPSLTDIDFHPHITKIIFKRRRSESDSFRVYLPSDEAVHNFYARDSINLRVAMVDASRGSVRRRFGGAAVGGDSSSDSDSEHSSDQDDLSSSDDDSDSDDDMDSETDGSSEEDSHHRRAAIGRVAAERRRRVMGSGSSILRRAASAASSQRQGVEGGGAQYGAAMEDVDEHGEQGRGAEGRADESDDEEGEEEEEEEEVSDLVDGDDDQDGDADEDGDELLDSSSSGEVHALHRYSHASRSY